MKRTGKTDLAAGAALLAAFGIWTWLVRCVDVRPIGPEGTSVGMAAFNGWFHRVTGVHMALYTLTDWLGLVPVLVCVCFGVMGAVQLFRRKSLLKVDPDILLLGVYYILVIAAYLLFEMIPVNYRPVLIDGMLEASYPSSTTLLVLSVMPTLASFRGGFFGFHGGGEAGFRRALGHGHHRLRAPEFRPVPGIPVLCGDRRRKENRQY